VLAGGLNLLSEEHGQTVFKHKYNGLKRYPSYGLYMDVRNITEDNDGRIWVGTMDGLMSFSSRFTSPEQIEFETYRGQSASSNIADNDIYVLYRDREGSIWVSVFGGGVSKLIGYDKITRRPLFKSYGLREGLNTDVVVSIVEDKDKYLWFVTEDGLSRFDRKTERIRNFDKYDGFFNVKMEESSALKTFDGELWLGCKQGVLIFSPDKIETLNVSYQTYIVDFQVSNRDLRSFREDPILMESVKYADNIELKHNQSMFTIEFAALNYYNQNRVSYKYILEGYETEWHFNGKNRIASYTNVPPGEYVFRVQSIDEANPELLSEKTLHITILPPWWRTWWAYTIYTLIGLALLWAILKLTFFMIRMKNDIYIEQRLSELKIKFFTNISHELRTPLTLIKGPIQELKEKESLTEKGKQYVELMEKNTNQMLQLVNQILDFRKIQSGKMRLHVSQINLNTLVKSFQKEFRVLAEENEISFNFQLADETIYLWADKEKLETVIRNIISNAFKFTPSGGSIFVSTGLVEGSERCYIRVEDNGVGIPQNKLSEIFERFSQGENARNAYYQGTGIGLALSKEIISLHHGVVKAESEAQQGAVFTVELLLGKDHYKPSEVDFYVGDGEAEAVGSDLSSAETQEVVNEEEGMDASLPTVLLVEDNKDLGNLLKLQLEDRYNIYLAANGVEGLKKVHLYHPDIVVTDQMMPEMSGTEMLQRIRQDFQISHIPVIILTAKNDDEAKTKAISMGANAYITKPFSKDYLIARIEQLLGERKLFRERVWTHSEEAQPDNYEQYLVKKDIQLLEKIHQVIEENLDNSDFNIDTIAANVGLSRSAFFKKLKSLTGLAPVDLVKEIRLNKSIELIKNTDMSISEIAFAVGFKDSGYYSKCFRKKYDQTPREYMNEWRKV
jgi:signal transduction histidine kinase/DNA-binding response OmpR family regulator